MKYKDFIIEYDDVIGFYRVTRDDVFQRTIDLCQTVDEAKKKIDRLTGQEK